MAAADALGYALCDGHSNKWEGGIETCLSSIFLEQHVLTRRRQQGNGKHDICIHLDILQTPDFGPEW